MSEFAIARSLASLFAVAALAAGCGSPPQNTGCNPACTTGFQCVDNACVPDEATKDMAIGPDMAGACAVPCAGTTPYCRLGQCVACVTDDQCPAGQTCQTAGDVTACKPGCATDDRCKGLGASFRCCVGQCLDTGKDVQNCGACGMVCAVEHGTGTCVDGACKAGQCVTGWGDCNNDPSDGCETSLHVDLDNCGACGMKCAIPNALAGCANGCYLASCTFGWDDCNGDPSDGCEQDVTSDMKNCGACGQPCNNKPHARNTCVASSCVVTACDPGYSDCNNDASDGCEVGTGTDPKNCGKCGNVCPMGLVCQNSSCTCPQCNIPNAKSKCVNNQCTFDSCLPGFADCNKNQADGCEVNLSNNPANCGTCGTVCPMNMAYCVQSVCTAAPQLVGQYNCGDGPAWGGNPQTYTCQEACALKFGGSAAQYSCSTVMGSVNHQANTSIWGIGGCQTAAEDFKKNSFYNCGAANCAQSAYVQDNCAPGTNYCYR